MQKSEASEAALKRRSQYNAVIRAVGGGALFSDCVTFNKEMLLSVESGAKRQTTRDYVWWRWDRICREAAEGRRLMVVEKSQFERRVVGLLEVEGALVRELSAMRESEWKDECVEKVDVGAFANMYLKEHTPVDRGEYVHEYTNGTGERKSVVRKVGVLRFGVFTSMEKYLEDSV
jgi:hypothetical protein